MSMYYSGNGKNAIFRKSIFESGECQPDRPQQVAGDFSTCIHSFMPTQATGARVRVIGDTQGPGHR